LAARDKLWWCWSDLAHELVSSLGFFQSFVSPNGDGTPAAALTAEPPHRSFVPLAARDGRLHSLPINTAMNHAYINGRDMVRAGSGAGVIGGPAKRVVGTISGSDYWIRHP
jgi:hypothetical protein